MPRSYAIIGTGALGGYYGVRLAQVGCDVHFLLNSDYEHVRAHGLILQSKDGDRTIPAAEVHAYNEPRAMPRCDVVAVALKTTHNHLLPAILPHAVKDDGVVLMMQNGLGIEAPIAALVGEDRVMGGLAFLCSNKVGPGHIHHLDYGEVRLGEYQPRGSSRGVTPRMQSIGNDFQRAGIPIVLADDLERARWQKLVWNVPYNGLSVALDARTDEIMTDPASRSLAEALMLDVLAGAAACGKPIPESFAHEMLDRTVRMKPYRTSMKIDYDEGQPMEVEAIFGNPVRAAQAAGAAVPRMEALYRQLKFLDARAT